MKKTARAARLYGSLFLLAAVLIFPCSLFAEKASQEMAEKVGAASLLAQREFSQQPRERSSRLKAGEAYSILRTEPLKDPDKERVLAYIIHLSPQGYMVVSSDTDITPVIAYSYRCDFVTEDSPQNIPLHMVTWDMQNRLDAIPLTGESIKETNNEEWDRFLSEDPSFLARMGKLTTLGLLARHHVGPVRHIQHQMPHRPGDRSKVLDGVRGNRHGTDSELLAVPLFYELQLAGR